jgi:aminoglycoside 6-adenylyltransferase
LPITKRATEPALNGEVYPHPPYLARGELWVVKFRDGTMKRMLLRLVEWDALARLGTEADVWHIGTHMRDWAAPDVWVDLHRCYAQSSARAAARKSCSPWSRSPSLMVDCVL